MTRKCVEYHLSICLAGMTETKYNLSDGCPSVGRYSSPWPLEYEVTVLTTQNWQRIPRKIWPWLMGYINTFVGTVWTSLSLWHACTAIINTLPHPSHDCMRVTLHAQFVPSVRSDMTLTTIGNWHVEWNFTKYQYFTCNDTETNYSVHEFGFESWIL